MLNKIILIGRLVRDPELRYTGNGVPVSNFTLAVERSYTNQQGERDVDFIRIVTWRKLAENCAHHLGKGRLVAVEGSLQIRKSKGDDGRTFVNPEVIANNVQFLDWPDDNNQRSNKDSSNGYSSSNNTDTDTDTNTKANNSSSNEDNDDEFDVPF